MIGFSLFQFQIEELHRIKASVNQELRDLEEKRSRLHSQVNGYNAHVSQLQSDYEKTSDNLQELKQNIENTKIEQDEIAKKNQPDLKPPQRILPSRIIEDNVSILKTTQHSGCTLNSCFDYSRCSLTSQFPVYFYTELLPDTVKLDSFIRDSVNHGFDMSPHLTFDPHIACIYVVLIGDLSNSRSLDSMQLTSYLHSLPYWHGDGRNHLILHFSRRLNSRSLHNEPLEGVDIGRAMVARSVYSALFSYRAGFDVIVPPSLGISHGEVWSDLPMITPARRKHLMTFQGEYLSSRSSGEERDEILASQERALTETAKQMQISYPDLHFLFQFSCTHELVPGLVGEWGLCGPTQERRMLLEQSTFTLIIAPTNTSSITRQRYVSTSTLMFQTRLYEALRSGAIPVILGKVLLF